MTTTEVQTWANSFQHEALFYAGIDEFLAGTTAVLREGLEHGDAMLVAVPEPRMCALRGELGGDAAGITFVDMLDVGHNPAQIIPAWREFLRDRGGNRPVRGIGEPIW